MDDYKVDFHIHTTASDGEATPTQIVKRAKELDYDIIAITDHDNTNGIAEGMIAAEAVGIKLVPGIEIAVVTEEETGLHMLGYNIDIENEALKKFLEEMVQRRVERNEQLFRVLQEMGYDITRDDIEVGKNDFIGKPLIARALVSKGYIAEEKQAFGREILGSAKCRAVKKVKPLAKDAIAVIKEAGGTPVLAHPIQTRGTRIRTSNSPCGSWRWRRSTICTSPEDPISTEKILQTPKRRHTDKYKLTGGQHEDL